MRIQNFQNKARTKLAIINKQYKPKIVNGEEITHLPLLTNMRKKFYEKAIDPIPVMMQKNLKKVFGVHYKQGFKMAYFSDYNRLRLHDFFQLIKNKRLFGYFFGKIRFSLYAAFEILVTRIMYLPWQPGSLVDIFLDIYNCLIYAWPTVCLT